MSELVDPDKIEGIVGAERHTFRHIALARSYDDQFFILHPEQCPARKAGKPLTECKFSLALDRGISKRWWTPRWQDRPVFVALGVGGDLRPAGPVTP